MTTFLKLFIKRYKNIDYPSIIKFMQKEPIENADLYKPVFNKLMITQEECMKQSFVASLNKFSGQIMVKFVIKFHRLLKFIFLSREATHSFVESKYTYFFIRNQ